MAPIAAAVGGLDTMRAAATQRGRGAVAISINGTEPRLSVEDLLVSMEPLEDYQVERDGSHAVALDESLRGECWTREIVHAIQGSPKAAGFESSDRITLTLDGATQLLVPRVRIRTTSPVRRWGSRSPTHRPTARARPQPITSRSTGWSFGSGSAGQPKPA